MIKRIVFTGGPGTGKTTVLDKLKLVYEPQGYRVIVIDETATYFILKGIKPFGENALGTVDFQELVMRMQLAKEEIFDRAAEMMGEDAKVLIVYDRGAIDNCAYMSQEQFEEVMARLNHVKSFAELMNQYDAVIDLVGRKDFYTLENNAARSEDADYALELGANTLKGWLGHSKVNIVLPKDTMDEKVNEVLNIINRVLAEKQVKRQDKYSVDLKNTDLDGIIRNSRLMKIEQTYLQSDANVERRIRKSELNNSVSYYFSVYKIMEDGSRLIVSEKSIDEKMYNQLMESRDTAYETIRKNRYYFSDNGTYFALDVFENMEDVGILEINVGEHEVVSIPSYVTVMEDVTNNKDYYNKNIARKDSKELKKV